jgi:hypothetical protein
VVEAYASGRRANSCDVQVAGLTCPVRGYPRVRMRSRIRATRANGATGYGTARACCTSTPHAPATTEVRCRTAWCRTARRAVPRGPPLRSPAAGSVSSLRHASRSLSYRLHGTCSLSPLCTHKGTCVFGMCAGSWVDDTKHGQGLLLYENGDEYDGQWEDDAKRGIGTMRWPSTRQMYAGKIRLPRCVPHTYTHTRMHMRGVPHGRIHAHARASHVPIAERQPAPSCKSCKSCKSGTCVGDMGCVRVLRPLTRAPCRVRQASGMPTSPTAWACTCGWPRRRRACPPTRSCCSTTGAQSTYNSKQMKPKTYINHDNGQCSHEARAAAAAQPVQVLGRMRASAACRGAEEPVVTRGRGWAMGQPRE